jgi:ribulose-5-phosphate 4-epimerase/fuculose-1-phosphate aldolase
MAAAAPDFTLIDKVVIANRILYDQGVVDGLGHVSARHNSDPGQFLLSCNRAPGLVKHADILCYDLDGNTVSPTSERSYLERFIHGEIYRARPDVMAVVHSHSPSVIPFGATGHRLRPIFHMAGFLGGGSSSRAFHTIGLHLASRQAVPGRGSYCDGLRFAPTSLRCSACDRRRQTRFAP